MNFDFSLYQQGNKIGSGNNDIFEYSLIKDPSQSIAVKVQHCEDTPESTMEYKFDNCLNEAINLYNCMHPNILKCFGF